VRSGLVEIMARLQRWLAAKGLTLNEAKTRLVDTRYGLYELPTTAKWTAAR
jgi:hypothetical protein